MKVFRNIGDIYIKTPTVLTFGVFDGLHLGHQLIIRTVVEHARAKGLTATSLTFDPHPRALLHPQTAPLLLQTYEQKMDGLERLGIEQTVVLTFNQELALVSAERFLLDFVFGRLEAREVCLGPGFAFGHNREGRFDLLDCVAQKLGRVAVQVPEVLVHRHRVSSTVIRRLLSAGRVNLARRMLGRPYSIESSVIEGRRLGAEKLSYPTANLNPRKCVIPANGVYVTLTMINGGWRRSVTNVGTRPTIGGDPEVVVETHLIDFNRNIYGERIRVRFLHRLRAEQKFDSLEALSRQIGSDRTRAIRYFESTVVGDNIDYR